MGIKPHMDLFYQIFSVRMRGMDANKVRILPVIIMISLILLLSGMHRPVLASPPGPTEKSKVLKIVIDPGHGGKAPGAVGPNGEREKDITLAVSKEIARRLREKGFEVFLTRDTDVYLPLEERTAFANRNKADLFVSVHVNANEKDSLQGVETYFLNLTTDAASMKVAKRENAMTSASLGSLQLIIKDLMLNAKINESSRFASSIQNSIVSSLEKSGHERKDHGVRQAPFYVLLGAQMPSVLVEIGFITNAVECRLLHEEAYQNSIIDGIVRGISTYAAHSTFAYNSRESE